jgi:hypothetical protein
MFRGGRGRSTFWGALALIPGSEEVAAQQRPIGSMATGRCAVGTSQVSS